MGGILHTSMRWSDGRARERQGLWARKSRRSSDHRSRIISRKVRTSSRRLTNSARTWSRPSGAEICCQEFLWVDLLVQAYGQLDALHVFREFLAAANCFSTGGEILDGTMSEFRAIQRADAKNSSRPTPETSPVPLLDRLVRS